MCWGPRGVLWISSDRDDRMGAKLQNPNKSLELQIKPNKIPGPKFNPQKTPRWISEPQKFPLLVCVIHRATRLGVRRNYHESCYPPPPNKKKSKFSNQNQKFQTPKTPLIIPVTSNLVYPPWGWGIFLPYLQKLGQNHHFHVWEEPFPKQLFIFCASVRATQYYIVDIA